MKIKMFFRFLFISLILVFIFSGSAVFSDMQDGLVAYYPFSGNANDESGYSNNGVVYGAELTSDRFGNPDSAYSFNGLSDFILVPESDSLNIQNEITLTAWVYHLSKPTAGFMQHIINKSLSLKGYRLAAWQPYGYSIELYNEDEEVGVIHDLMEPYIGIWTHVAGTWDGDVLRIYRNGLLSGESVFQGLLSIANTDLYIGVINPVPYPSQGYFHGYIDELRVYNRALTNDEVNKLIAIKVDIDIAPNNTLNNLNPDRGGRVAVAILSSNSFDALEVNEALVTFGPGNAYAIDEKTKDVDKDGDLDLILYFNVNDAGITCFDTELSLDGETYDGLAITGTDLITVKSCE